MCKIYNTNRHNTTDFMYSMLCIQLSAEAQTVNEYYLFAFIYFVYLQLPDNIN